MVYITQNICCMLISVFSVLLQDMLLVLLKGEFLWNSLIYLSLLNLKSMFCTVDCTCTVSRVKFEYGDG